VLLEDADHRVDHFSSYRHLLGVVVAGALGWLDLKFRPCLLLLYLLFYLLSFLSLLFLFLFSGFLVGEAQGVLVLQQKGDFLAGALPEYSGLSSCLLFGHANQQIINWTQSTQHL
jgi:hypothetical protein